MAPLKAQNYITLMEGTENQKSFYLQNPSQPTQSDIDKIKKAYGIDCLLYTSPSPRDS